MSHTGWIAVDLDGTLAEYAGWTGDPYVIGKPIPKMVDRIKQWIREGKQVRIFTARVSPEPWRHSDNEALQLYLETVTLCIQRWCSKNIGVELPITYKKDASMIELWDDRAVQIIPNTGERADGKP